MKKVVLKHKLSSAPTAQDFEIINVDTPKCPADGVLVRVKYISIDPYIGHQLSKGHMASPPPAPLTEVIPGAIVGEVIESNSGKAKPGDFIHSMAGGWAESFALRDNQYTLVDPNAAPLSAYAGVLGMPGLTAWAGVTQLAKVRDADVFAVNAAAGPVGGTAGQIARMKGAKTVIGIAGGDVKCKLVEDVYGFDKCVDYKSASWHEDYKAAAPDGISVHYENVGSEQLAFAMQNLKLYGRVILCGLAAHYHESEPAMTMIGPMVGKRAAVSGLVVYDYFDRWDAFRSEVAPWVKSGAVKFYEDKAAGLEQAGALMEKLMNGQNVGKCIVEL